MGDGEWMMVSGGSGEWMGDGEWVMVSVVVYGNNTITTPTTTTTNTTSSNTTSCVDLLESA